tara:strand:+ start:536 stop:904 length:369 start_codon:yes stop_codon:yes gene_type:complete
MKQNEKLIVEALAKADGYEAVHFDGLGMTIWCKESHDGYIDYAPENYLTSLDALAPLIEGLSYHELDDFRAELWKIVNRDFKGEMPLDHAVQIEMFRPRAHQWAEAYLKSRWMWTKEMEGEA